MSEVAPQNKGMDIPFSIFNDITTMQGTMRKLSNTDYNDFKTSYRVKRFLDTMEKEFDYFKDMYGKIMENAEWEGDDKPVLKNKEDIETKVKELGATTFHNKWLPLPLSVAEEINPSPNELATLEKFLDPTDLEDLV
jgi:hypothetical protein